MVPYVKKGNRWFTFTVFCIDLFLIWVTYIVSFKLKFGLNLPTENMKSLHAVLPYILVAAPILFYMYGLYDTIKKSTSEILITVTIVMMILDFVTMAVAFWSRGFAFPRSIMVIAPMVQVILFTLWRIIVRAIRRREHGTKQIMIIGTGEELEETARKVILSSDKLYELKHLIAFQQNFEEIREKIKEVDEVFLCAEIPGEAKSKIVSFGIAAMKNIFIVPRLFEIAIGKSNLHQFDDLPMFKIESMPLSIEQRIMKRTFDIVVSLVGIILTSPLMLLTAAAIKLQDGGPILFKQERVTIHNRSFNVYKFRSMIANAEQYTGPVLASEDDPRITGLGRFLRASRLDELPQLFNVFFGHMSMVGPRPERPHFMEQFSKEIPDFEYRVMVKGGITGLAQVLGKYTTDPRDKLRYDLLYIRNYSFWLDVQMILYTIKIMFIKESAEGVKNKQEHLIKQLRKSI